MAGASAAGASAAGASVAGASVAGASVAGASVAGASVAGASVAGASVAGVSVAGASVAGASVAGASVSGTSLTTTTGSAGFRSVEEVGDSASTGSSIIRMDRLSAASIFFMVLPPTSMFRRPPTFSADIRRWWKRARFIRQASCPTVRRTLPRSVPQRVRFSPDIGKHPF